MPVIKEEIHHNFKHEGSSHLSSSYYSEDYSKSPGSSTEKSPDMFTYSHSELANS